MKGEPGPGGDSAHAGRGGLFGKEIFLPSLCLSLKLFSRKKKSKRKKEEERLEGGVKSGSRQRAQEI